ADDEHVQGILRGGGAEPGEMLRAVRGCEGGPLLIGHLTAPSHRDLRFPSDGRRAPSAGRTAAGRGGRHRGPCVHPFASSVHERARLAFMTRDSRLEGLYSVARMYYEQGQTMEAIASTLRGSRSTVSRMLRDAREAELVTISLRPPEAQRVEELARRIARQYGVAVRVVPSVPEDDQRERLRTVTEAGGALLDEMLEPGTTLGLAWGTTIASLLGSVRARPVPGMRIVQLNGAINTEGSGLTYIGAVLSRAATRWDA